MVILGAPWALLGRSCLWRNRLPKDALAAAVRVKVDAADDLLVEPPDGIVQPILVSCFANRREGIVDVGRPPFFLKGLQDGFLILGALVEALDPAADSRPGGCRRWGRSSWPRPRY
jgi:hypothetical protein